MALQLWKDFFQKVPGVLTVEKTDMDTMMSTHTSYVCFDGYFYLLAWETEKLTIFLWTLD